MRFLAFFLTALPFTELSAAYRFLCIYKILEGVPARRGRLVAARKHRPILLYRPETVPNDLAEGVKWLTELFDRKWDSTVAHEIIHPEVRGRKFKFIVNSVLRPIRNRVAHGVLESGEPSLLADEPSHLNEIYRWLPLAHCISRHMLKNEFPEDLGPGAQPSG